MNTEAPPRINLYEGLFLFPQSATANLQEAVDHTRAILDRGNAKIVSFRKWDERRLAYEIKGNKRGVYFLVYFKANTTKLNDIDRGIVLSEQLLRAMITRADHLPEEIIEAADGQQELADEIKLRASQDDAGTGDGAGRTSRVERRSDDDSSSSGSGESATATATADPPASTDDEGADGGDSSEETS